MERVYTYEKLPNNEKNIVDAVIAFLNGKTVAEAKQLLTIAQIELNNQSKVVSS